MNTYDITFYITHIRDTLASTYPDTVLCQQYAWWMLQAITEKSKIELIAHETVMLSDEKKELLAHWLDLLTHKHMPIAYILGSVPFCDLDILVQTPTLIPRPETEEWCLHIIEHLQLLDNKKIKILDIATGSGCIALALAQHLPQADIIATDIADSALELAERNRQHNRIRNVTFIQSDLFASLPEGTLFDIIVSNPPYIAPSEWNTLDNSVSQWEDYNALIAQDDGFALIKKIIVQAPHYIQPNEEMKNKNIPQIIIEIGHEQGPQTKQLMENAGYNEILIQKDLEKKNRFAVGRVDYVATDHP
jgi:release factor glutamine methyltransferase